MADQMLIPKPDPTLKLNFNQTDKFQLSLFNCPLLINVPAKYVHTNVHPNFHANPSLSLPIIWNTCRVAKLMINTPSFVEDNYHNQYLYKAMIFELNRIASLFELVFHFKPATLGPYLTKFPKSVCVTQNFRINVIIT